MTAAISYAMAEFKSSSISSPARTCEMRQSTWCIYLGPSEIINHPSQSVAYRSTWIVKGVIHPDKPFIVLEPRGCREGFSDVVNLVGFDARFKWDEKNWNRIVVRLKSDKSCDLELLSPIREDEPSGEAFFGSIALIQSCTTTNCEGSVLGEHIRSLVNPK